MSHISLSLDYVTRLTNYCHISHNLFFLLARQKIIYINETHLFS